MHRVVMYRDGGNRARLMEPYTVTPPLGSPNPVDLWKWMVDYEKKTTGQVLAIAHNGNMSNGIMFPEIKAFGKKIDKNTESELLRRDYYYLSIFLQSELQHVGEGSSYSLYARINTCSWKLSLKNSDTQDLSRFSKNANISRYLKFTTFQ